TLPGVGISRIEPLCGLVEFSRLCVVQHREPPQVLLAFGFRQIGIQVLGAVGPVDARTFALHQLDLQLRYDGQDDVPLPRQKIIDRTVVASCPYLPFAVAPVHKARLNAYLCSELADGSRQHVARRKSVASRLSRYV